MDKDFNLHRFDIDKWYNRKLHIDICLNKSTHTELISLFVCRLVVRSDRGRPRLGPGVLLRSHVSDRGAGWARPGLPRWARNSLTASDVIWRHRSWSTLVKKWLDLSHGAILFPVPMRSEVQRHLYLYQKGPEIKKITSINKTCLVSCTSLCNPQFCRRGGGWVDKMFILHICDPLINIDE